MHRLDCSFARVYSEFTFWLKVVCKSMNWDFTCTQWTQTEPHNFLLGDASQLAPIRDALHASLSSYSNAHPEPHNSSSSDAFQLAPVRDALHASLSSELPLRRFAFECVIDMRNPATWPIVYKGKEYAGIAARKPVFIPHPAFLVIDPIWTQCSCIHGCFKCVYDGASLCTGCQTSPCDCEPGCCGVPLESDDSSSDERGDASQLADSNVEAQGRGFEHGHGRLE